MPKTFIVKYHAVHKDGEIEIKAFSKYDAKQRFYRMYPKYEILNIYTKEDNDER